MIVEVLQRDDGFRSWLARHPGLWREVGVLDEAAALIVMTHERRRLQLPRLARRGCGTEARGREEGQGARRTRTATRYAGGVGL